MTTDSNDLTRNYSGIFGNQVLLKNRRGRSVMIIPPRKQPVEPTENQLRVRNRFKLAAKYATQILQDPGMLAAYTARSRKGRSAYAAAVTDFLKPPFIEEIQAGGYTGQPGERISVVAGDDFAVASVTVQILDAGGSVIEQGACEINPVSANYDYIATVPVAALTGVTIRATVRDFPDHAVEKVLNL